MDLFARSKGPRDASILVVGESEGAEEQHQGRPFVGGSGQEWDRILTEGGVDPSSVFMTNLFRSQPQGNDAWRFFHDRTSAAPLYRGLQPTDYAMSELDRLHRLIQQMKPKLVIAAGNYALWATTDCASTSSIPSGTGATVLVPAGITSWRGSMLETDTVAGCPKLKVLPVIHPAAILRQWSLRQVTIHDIRARVPMGMQGLWRPPQEPYVEFGHFERTVDMLRMWLAKLDSGGILSLSNDIETSRRCITCMALATGGFDETGQALVVPFVRPPEKKGQPWLHYWTQSQEVVIVVLLARILSHRNVRIIGQNYLYDSQYIDPILGITPNLDFDTMLAHHLLFPGTPQGLDYLSSLYCRYHWYWKEDLKEWDESADFEKNLYYNAEDALRTAECAGVLSSLIVSEGMQEQWEWEKKKWKLAKRMSNRGVLIDRQERARLAFELMSALQERHTWLSTIIPQTWVAPLIKTSKKNWWQSVDQQKKLFFEVMGLKGQTNRSTGKPTVNFEALEALKKNHPEFTRIFDALIDCRSIAVYHNTFIEAALDGDRLKSQFKPTGTKTFRWSSSENAFGYGTNLQNIPIGEAE